MEAPKPAVAAAPAAEPKPVVQPAKAAPAPTPAKVTPPPEPKHEAAPDTGADDSNDPDVKQLDAWLNKGKDKEAKQPEGEAKPDAPKGEIGKDKAAPKEGPAQLRAEYEKVKTEATTLKEQYAQAQAKLAEAEAKGKDVTVLTERVEKLQKDYEATQAELRAARQEVSPDFQEKYDKPFKQAITFAQKALSRIIIADPITGEQRRVDFDKDFVPLYRAAAMEEGSIDFSALKNLFGDADVVAKNHLEKLLSLNDVREAALTEEKTQWKAKEEESKANQLLSQKKQAEEREAFQKLRTEAFTEVEQSNPEIFGEVTGDDESNAKLKEGREYAATQPKTPQEAAKLHAELYHRASAHPRLLHQIEKLKAELAERDAKIAEYKGSAPGQGRRSSDTPEGDGEDFATGLRNLA